MHSKYADYNTYNLEAKVKLYPSTFIIVHDVGINIYMHV